MASGEQQRPNRRHPEISIQFAVEHNQRYDRHQEDFVGTNEWNY